MRLNPAAIATIECDVADTLGRETRKRPRVYLGAGLGEAPSDNARVRLFGSRFDDARKGGDADLLFEAGRPVERATSTAGTLEARLIRALGGRKADVNLVPPNVPERTIHCDARAEGVLL
jgi:hypothetical protein